MAESAKSAREALDAFDRETNEIVTVRAAERLKVVNAWCAARDAEEALANAGTDSTESDR
jgi:hypothetical protein